MIYVFFAEGFEETEGITTVDILRRAKLEIATVGVGSKTIAGSHSIRIECDCEIDTITPDTSVEAIVLPGGMPGTINLEKSKKVQDFIDYAYLKNKLICAICAAPIILGHKGILKGINATCFPGFEAELSGSRISDGSVCRDQLFITAKGMGATIDFGLEIVKHFAGEAEAKRLRESLQCP